ncbi:hypothetical protein HAP48_0024155 [Bradyrhizobium septentrionale]|uniref:Uncharacterized protein n=1 Tax=Bradyrhizobium septentrionale TaxID=1404411 RepID=A0A973VWQ4_9BRAD|nr:MULTISPECIES: hypothetical protein [Bradyrhizobium]UGY20246.1 hypothetical protein HAP48_0024155 [Bradyrhizobium septentrionale]UGY29086.1 hypothetical protein HU675_0021480 [Bradyrhizobium septentrionale]
MGQKKIRKARFLALHPRCCFCGGNERTADIDHQPARALFNGRVGPEDFEFPACAACNQSSRHHENAMAVLVRLRDTRDDLEVYQEDLRKYFTSMGNNFPSLVRPMTSNEKRSFLKDEGVQRPPGYVLSDLKMVTGSDFAIDAIENVFRKLLVALHYKHSGRIAAAGAAVTLVWFTNAYADRAKEIEQFISALMAEESSKEAIKISLISSYTNMALTTRRSSQPSLLRFETRSLQWVLSGAAARPSLRSKTWDQI